VQQSLRNLALAAARTVDPALHARIHASADEATPAYQRAIEPLESLQRSLQDVHYVYTLRPTSDGEVEYVLDPSNEQLPGNPGHVTPGTRCQSPDRALLDAVRLRRATVSPRVYTDAWGSFVSGYAPVTDVRGDVECYVGIDMDASTYQARIDGVHLAAGIGLAIAALGSASAGVAVAGWRGRLLADERRSKAAREQLERARAEAVAADHAKSELVANVSHEIRTPMTAILGYAELLRDERAAGVSTALGEDAIDSILHNGEHLLGVINDIVDGARIEACCMEVHRVPMDLLAVTKDAAGLLAVRARAKGLALEVTSDAPPEVWSDPLRVRQILLNLVGNAIKFTDRGGIDVHVSTDAGDAVISVRDSGPGMDHAQLAQLFRRYSQVSPDRAAEGSGLGLALSRHLARLLGGDITVESAPGRGTRFRVRLPLAKPAMEADPADFTCEVPPLGSQELHGMRILLADDGIDNVRLFRHHLSRAGAEVTVASDGREAVALVRAAARGVLTDQFDLVLMDLEMPIMDGIEAARIIRAEVPGLPVVALTAQSLPTSAARGGGDSGFVAMASKPIDRRALVRLAAQWGRRTARTADGPAVEGPTAY
jgi:signal transduction histidine kinase/CheY-like chemotaxis protein